MTTAVVEAEQAFSKQVRDALSGAGKDIDAAVTFIAGLYHADVDALQERLDAANDEVRHALSLSTQDHYLLQGVLGSVAREVLRSAQLQARNDHQSKQLGMMGAMARQSETGALDADSVLEVLRSPIPRIPFRPHVAAFYPDTKYRYGHFASPDGVVTQVWPFAGWSLVIDVPDRAADRLQATFLVDGDVVPLGTLRLDRGIELKRFS